MKTYAKHGDPDYASKTAAGCETDGEPHFLLRAQDLYAEDTVRHWAALAKTNGQFQMAEEARRIANAMAHWPTRKLPD